jgi:hypothetical protein
LRKEKSKEREKKFEGLEKVKSWRKKCKKAGKSLKEFLEAEKSGKE